MVEVEYIKDRGIFKKGHTMIVNNGLASDLIKYSEGAVILKKPKKKKSK